MKKLRGCIWNRWAGLGWARAAGGVPAVQYAGRAARFRIDAIFVFFSKPPLCRSWREIWFRLTEGLVRGYTRSRTGMVHGFIRRTVL